MLREYLGHHGHLRPGTVHRLEPAFADALIEAGDAEPVEEERKPKPKGKGAKR